MLGQKQPMDKSAFPKDSMDHSAFTPKPSSTQSQTNQMSSCRQVRKTSSTPPGGYLMYRAPGMFDLSNIKSGSACAEHRSSIYNIYEEFHRQFGLLQRPDSKQLCPDSRGADDSNKG